MRYYASLKRVVVQALQRVSEWLLPTSRSNQDHIVALAEQKALRVVRHLKNDNYKKLRDEFVAPLRWFLREEILRTGWRVVRRGTGAIVEIGRPEASTGLYTVTKIPVQFQLTSLVLVIRSTRLGGIFGLQVLPKALAGFKVDWRTPPYADSTLFKEHRVQVGLKLKTDGTLTLPLQNGKHPCIIMLSGSGPCDQDFTVGSVKPFKDLAQGLASAGIATIRFDKVTLKHPRKYSKETMTMTDEYMEQASDAILQAQRSNCILSDRIFILGHSLGAVVAPRLAGTFPNTVAGMILMAAPSRPIYHCAIEQMKYLNTLVREDALNQDDQEDFEKELSVLQAQAARADDPSLTPTTRPTELPFGIGAPYWLDYRNYAPIDTVRHLQKPILLLQGKRDYQVTMSQDYAAWHGALQGHSYASFKMYDTLNHLFVEGKGRPTPREYDLSGNVGVQVRDDIVSWVKDL